MKEYLVVTKALSDGSRVRLLCALRGGELCVCQLIDLLGFAPSTVSKHLSILSQAGLVESRKAGRWVHYRLPGKAAGELCRRMTEETFRLLEGCAQMRCDEERLELIRREDPELICRRITQRG